MLLLRDFVLSLDDASPTFGGVASVFTCAFLECLLEEQVYMMALMDMDYNDAGILADLLLESHQGRTRLLQLYRRLGYRSLSDDASVAGSPGFPEDWQAIARARNAVLHGKPEEATTITPILIRRALADGLEVFRSAHNSYNSETHAYKMATQKLRKLDEESERLRRWGRPLSAEADDL